MALALRRMERPAPCAVTHAIALTRHLAIATTLAHGSSRHKQLAAKRRDANALSDMSSSFLQRTLSSQSFSSLVKDAVEPSVSATSLLAIAHFNHEVVDFRYATLALLSVVITFPGKWPAVTLARFLRDLATSWTAHCGMLLLVGLVTGTLSMFPTRVIVLWVLAAPPLTLAACVLLKKGVRGTRLMRARKKKSVIVGASALSQKFMQTISDDNMSLIEIVGIFDDRDSQRRDPGEHGRVLGKIGDVAAYCGSHAIDRIYITLPMSSHPRIMQLMNDLHDTTVSIYFLPDVFLYDLIQARLDTLNGIPILAICETPFLGVNGLIKQASDLLLGSLILLLIAPLMLAVAIGIKVSSRGPVLFRQRRYGLDGREIVVYKFRSMTVCEDGPEVTQVRKNDARVTPIGAFLRRTSLDELPQFINVLQGRMSIVGPRPHAIAHNEMYRKLIKSYMVRHKVKPGITGWAQINGCRGETESLDKMERRIAYDLEYLRNWSLLLDVWIIVRTLLIVLRDRNAY